MSCRMLLVGSGRMGQLRAKLIGKNAKMRLAGVVDPNAQLGGELAREHSVPHFASLGEALRNVETDGVCISANVQHKELVFECAEAGKHVMCEKPLAHGVRDVRAIVDKAIEENINLLTCWMRLRDPEYKRLYDESRGDEIRTISLTSRDHPVPPVETMASLGSQFEDCLVHDLSVMFMLNNLTPPTAVTGGLGSVVGPRDTALATLNFADGSVATAISSRFSPIGYQQMAEVCTSSSILRAGGELEGLAHSFPDRYETAFGREVDYFASVLSGEVQHDMDYERRLNILIAQVTDVLQRSEREGRTIRFRDVTEPIRTAVVGAGPFGLNVHCANLLRLSKQPADPGDAPVEFLGVVKRTEQPEIIPLGSGQVNNLGPIESSGVLDMDSNVQAVVIASPDGTHADMSLAALASGKHVLCEKPAAWNTEQASEVFAEAERSGMRFMIGFQRRFDPAFQTARARALELMGSGELKSITITSADPVPFDPEEHDPHFVMHNSIIHDVDMMTFLLNLSDCDEPPYISDVTVDGPAICMSLLVAAEDGPNVEVQINYTKESETYVQEVTLNGSETFGHNVKQGWDDCYEKAYVDETRAFLNSVRDIESGIDPTTLGQDREHGNYLLTHLVLDNALLELEGAHDDDDYTDDDMDESAP